MIRQIRRSVYETNSSSMHAICIPKNSKYKKSKYVNFEFGEFGWEFNIYKEDLWYKASYLITAIYYGFDIEYTDKKVEQLKNILDRNNIEYKMPQPNIKSYEYYGKVNEYYDIDGYVDHAEDTKDFIDTVLSDDEMLMRYLFGDSMIITGNDNSDGYRDYMYDHDENDYWNCSLKKEFDDYVIFEKGN